ncbi:hypothetical protein [Methylocaldum sp.]|uniref:hypothetical protein n=1 Tax=Methylocaldum sp. TaxID=1969727 RepID=UPI002D6F6A8F|nr:hypothetical protein [Methylocaldum sp.]HYE35513.1 hypothetical protein [Methylocaldum sp.]
MESFADQILEQTPMILLVMGWDDLIYIVILAATTALSLALAPKPPKPKAATLQDFDVPTAEEGRPVPVVFGTVTVKGPNVIWYGHLRTKAIKSKGGKK